MLLNRLLLPLLLTGCVHQPELPLNQTGLADWLSRRGLETRELQIDAWPAGSGAASGMPQRVRFKTTRPAELEAWRLRLRDDLGAWLTDKGHPEGQCTSVDLSPAGELLSVDIQIVCR